MKKKSEKITIFATYNTLEKEIVTLDFFKFKQKA